jgi:hypothetical protein
VRSADTVATAGRVAPLMLRVEARRPAAWITLAVAGGGSLWLPAEAAAPLAAVVGGLLAVAAIGHLPGRVGLVAPAAWSLLPWVRVAWPVAGGLLAVAWLALRGGLGAALVAGGLAASAAVTAAVFAACLRRGGIAAVAASQALAINGLGAAAGLAVMVAGGSPAAQVAAILAAWGLAAGGHLAAQVHDRPMSLGAGRHRRPLAGSGPAMASALGGMAGCYFLAPQFAWAYAWIAVGWFVALAVPAATPPGGRAATARLVQSAVGWPAVPASLTRGMSLVATTAGLLAWPAVVAAVLAGPEAWGAGGPLSALAVLAAAVGLTLIGVTIAAVVSGLRWIGELARAVLLSAAAVAAIGAAAWAAGLPAAPGLPGLTLGRGPRAFQTGVEGCRASCQTS